MQTRNYRPTTEQKEWWDAISEMGSAINGRKPVQIHHIAGAAARHDKVYIGHWFCLPLTEEQHAVISNLGRKAFERDYGTTEKRLFERVCNWYRRRFGDLPFSQEVYDACLSWHR